MTESVPSVRVSVVLCTYRGTAFLEAQLESLRSQTLQPAELIVCDDNSGDETVPMLESFRERVSFPVHLVINRENLGSTRNFDQALQLATGEFLALCDQDDVWLPRKLATLARILEHDKTAGGVFSDASLIDLTGVPIAGVSSKAHQTLWQLHGFNEQKQRRFVQGATHMLLQHDVVTGATLMVRKSLRSTWHPIPPSWVHDGWIAWMLAIYSHLVLVPEPLIAYRVHAQQQLGVGGSRADRIRGMRETERLRYAKVATQFEELYLRIQTLPSPNPKLLYALDRKIALLRRRSRLPHALLPRLFWMLLSIPSYRRYARGWRSFRKDLLLS